MKKRKSSEGNRAMDFLKEIYRRFGNESNIFKMRSNANSCISPEMNENVKEFLEKTTKYSILDDMVAAFTALEGKLESELSELSAENRLLEEKMFEANQIDQNQQEMLASLKDANQRLSRENAIFFNDSLRHCYLKLQTNELTFTRNQMMDVLEDKRQQSLVMRCELDKLLQEHQGLVKEREKAGLSVAHICTKLKELNIKCREFDILKEEQFRRRLLISRMRQREGLVRVYLLTRPTLTTSCVSFISLQKVAVEGQITGQPKEKSGAVFQFHRAFKPNDEMNMLFEDIRIQAATALDGFNTAFVAYGQTGTGKTRTMFGTQNKAGLMQYIMRELLNEGKNSKHWSFTFSCAALEVTHDGVFDVLAKKTSPVHLKDDGLKLSMGKTIAEVDIIDADDVIATLNQIKECSTTGRSSRVKEGSTRHHLVVVFRVRGVDNVDTTSKTIDGTILMVDLAGFEDVNHLVELPRDIVNEAFASNRALNCLSEVLMAIRKKKKPIPFHRSPLTTLLKPCLLGEAHFCILLHSNTQVEDRQSIVKTMRFGLNATQKSMRRRRRRVIWKV